MEIVLTLWALEEGFLPGTPTAFPPDPACALPLTQEARPLAAGASASTSDAVVVLKTALGFGGFNGAAVLACPSHSASVPASGQGRRREGGSMRR